MGPHIKVGVNPVSKTHMYLSITEDCPTKEHIDPATWAEVCAGLLRPFTDPAVQAFIPHFDAPGVNIDYRPLANLLVPLPWNRGRVVLIGDTVAATTPHLASGAGIGIESGIVLAEDMEDRSGEQLAVQHDAHRPHREHRQGQAQRSQQCGGQHPQRPAVAKGRVLQRRIDQRRKRKAHGPPRG